MTFAILCSGQGGQGRTMFEALGADPRADAILTAGSRLIGTELRTLVTRCEDTIFQNAIAQPLVCAAQLAYWAALKDDLPPVQLIAGYSLGELSAYGCSDTIHPYVAIALAHQRAQAMNKSCVLPQRMSGVRQLSRKTVQAAAEDCGVYIAIVKPADRFVVAGASAAMAEFEQRARGLGGIVSKINVGIASHTPLMNVAAREMEPIYERASFGAPTVPVVAGIDGSLVRTPSGAVDALSFQISHTIDWQACTQTLIERGVVTVLELGPGCELARDLRDEGIAARSVAEFRSLAGIVAWTRRATQS